MNKFNSTEEVPLFGEVFRIRKFDPETACYWANQVIANIAGGWSGQSMAALRSQMPQMIKSFLEMAPKKHGEFFNTCLSFVDVKFPTGFHSLISDQGTFAKQDLPNPAFMVLMTRSFMFSISDFLDPSLLTELVGGALAHISEPEAGSTNSFTSPSALNIGNMTISGMENITSPTFSPS